jgi:hypothetical protein
MDEPGGDHGGVVAGGRAVRSTATREHGPPARREGAPLRPPGARERGQSSVELLAVLPVLLAVAFAAAQLLAVGYSSVLAGNAAEAGALALAGADAPAAAREAEAAARAALPRWSRRRLEVSVEGGEVTVRLRPPTLLRALSGELEVAARAAVEP